MAENADRLPGFPDREAMRMEIDVLRSESHDPRLTDAEREDFVAQADEALANGSFVVLRETLLATRPALDLPYPDKDESFQDYYGRLIELVDVFDASQS